MLKRLSSFLWEFVVVGRIGLKNFCELWKLSRQSRNALRLRLRLRLRLARARRALSWSAPAGCCPSSTQRDACHGLVDTNPDQRCFSANFKKPTRVRLEHDGKVVYDQTLEGKQIVYFAPFSGKVVVFLNDQEAGGWEVS